MGDTVHGGLLTVVDYAAIAILLGSMLLGMLRGLVRELFNLVGWVVAFFVARAFGPTLAHWLPADLPGGEMTQGALGFLLVLVAVVFGAGIVSALVGRMTDLIGLRPADRGLGMLFGIVRGVLLLMLLMVAARLTALPQQPAWQHSLTRPWVEAGLERLMPYLPEPVQHYLRKPEAAVPSMPGVNSLNAPVPLPQLEPYRGAPSPAPGTSEAPRAAPQGQGGQGSRVETTIEARPAGQRTPDARGAQGDGARVSGISALMGADMIHGGRGMTSQGGSGAAGAQSQGWGMRSGGSAAPSTGLQKVSE
ncbi:CvpA family protein [Pandoraea nosoerga]|uniref:Colicin v production transmembrane protein n=1 Tax=Pandoraea nosoerga TaxID=2508296 RepID=A0A5E4TU32_9BURK|nr:MULTISPECIES: CvpA family protein [Pandoraea]MBN4665005.1 CvpA family protein [Pandoraea nosoerga]MBN4675279.1 CvpA family protein [Pandoraea nosoerga]MBN4680748.1 CvpA family protein [Pandoraea nosoerga]MBN4745933.1 CvpA family protein [Pandoraea nosoerga]VVD91446.1 colicin v production transmembrane protein [Pandoraea nosoerga]